GPGVFLLRRGTADRPVPQPPRQKARRSRGGAPRFYSRGDVRLGNPSTHARGQPEGAKPIGTMPRPRTRASARWAAPETSGARRPRRPLQDERWFRGYSIVTQVWKSESTFISELNISVSADAGPGAGVAPERVIRPATAGSSRALFTA